MPNGRLITFEGGEGVGKTTQIKRLEKALTESGHNVITTREPGGTPAAEKIRNLLSDKDLGGKWTPDAELLLLFAARSMHIRDIIAPALSANKIILCDRYIDSTRVYQGYIGDVQMDFINILEREIVGNYIPTLTLIFDLDSKTAMQRVRHRGAQDHYDRRDIEFYEKLRQGFLKLSLDNQDRCKIIDAHQTEEAIAETVLKTVTEHIK